MKNKQLVLAFSPVIVFIVMYAIGYYVDEKSAGGDLLQLLMVPATIYSIVVTFIVKRWIKLVPILIIILSILIIVTGQALKDFS